MELMVVFAILTVLAGIAVPNLIAWLPKYRLNQAAGDIHSMLQNARMQAIKANRPVVVLFDPDGNGKLEGEYLAFVHKNETGGSEWTRESDEPIVARGRVPRGVEILRTEFAQNRLRFNSRGLLMDVNKSVFLKNSRNLSKEITVYVTGNSRIE